MVLLAAQKNSGKGGEGYFALCAPFEAMITVKSQSRWDNIMWCNGCDASTLPWCTAVGSSVGITSESESEYKAMCDESYAKA